MLKKTTDGIVSYKMYCVYMAKEVDGSWFLSLRGFLKRLKNGATLSLFSQRSAKTKSAWQSLIIVQNFK